MSVGRTFHTRGPATTVEFVRHVQPGSLDHKVASFAGWQPTVWTTFAQLYEAYCWAGQYTMSDVIHHGTQIEPN